MPPFNDDVPEAHLVHGATPVCQTIGALASKVLATFCSTPGKENMQLSSDYPYPNWRVSYTVATSFRRDLAGLPAHVYSERRPGP